MNKEFFLNPLGFLYGECAEQAIQEKLALPFVSHTQQIAFSLVERFAGSSVSQSTIHTVHGLDEALQKQVKILTAPLPLAGLPAGPLVMGILNVTPDSFSDGGRHFSLADSIRAGHQMVKDGAAIIDIGGESTRPGSQPVSIQEECDRIVPVIKALKGCGAYLSVDTRHTETMKHALEAGADIINDISALEDEGSAALVAEAQCPVILMHMRGNPQTMSNYAVYEQVLYEVLAELDMKITRAVQAGIARERIILDPGIGFAKTYAQNLLLMKNFAAFANLGCRLLLAVSRKRVIREATGNEDPYACDYASALASSPAFLCGNGIVRVHNVPAMMQTLKMWQALHS